jgi:hypothetical protein
MSVSLALHSSVPNYKALFDGQPRTSLTWSKEALLNLREQSHGILEPSDVTPASMPPVYSSTLRQCPPVYSSLLYALTRSTGLWDWSWLAVTVYT